MLELHLGSGSRGVGVLLTESKRNGEQCTEIMHISSRPSAMVDVGI